MYMHVLRNVFLYIFYWIFRALISLRYRIEVVGLSKIIKSKECGVLFLPNHPAEMDPLIMICLLWRHFKVRPLAIEHFYYQKGLRFFMDLVGAVPLPTMDVSNQWKVRQVEKLKEKILKQVKEGKNFLIYPSGKLKLTPDEQIGGASLVPELLNLNPQMKIVLIRTIGFWGSSFSRALTGISPDFGKMLWAGVKIILKNGIFFTPRRHVKVELEFAPDDMPRQGEKLKINRWLENWYNKDGPEPLKLVSYAFWKEDLAKVSPPEKIASMEKVAIPEKMLKQILGHLSKISRLPVEEISPNLHLSNDLGLDSLDISQLYVYLEERFEISGLVLGELQTVSDMLQAAAGVRKEMETPLAPKKKSKWPFESHRPSPQMAPGKTLQEVFLNNCDRMGDGTACADGLSGVLSYRKLKRAALVLSLEIEKMPGDNIGILLPASVAAYVTIFAALLAGKTPVMLNWTAGFRNLEHAAEVCNLQVVLSSFRFLSRLENGNLGRIDDLLMLLEEMRREISFKTKLKGLFLSFRKAQKIIQKLPRHPNEEDSAVIIFTSGTETLPKGVPLSHRNLLSNQNAALSCISVQSSDILYGVLPPFHSFGFSVTGIFPLLAGIKVCYAPDPTDSRALSNDIAHWKPTFFCCAPTFVQAVLRIASDEELKSLKKIMTGGEKAPQELFDTLQLMGKIAIEGYGISECSPIVTLERENEPHKGVGRALPNVELCVIDPETDQKLEMGQEGEVCIFGPSVFGGYLGVKKDPFIEIENKKWYRSGDRGYLEKDGTLMLTGRLKRFVKIGGEMVSLGGLEEDLISICMKKKWAPSKIEGRILAVTALGRESEKPQIILFTTFDVERETLNIVLKEEGHGRLVKIAEIHKIAEIPLTGIGKTHYHQLDEMLKSPND